MSKCIEEKLAAAYTLSDEIYNSLMTAKKISNMTNSIHDDMFTKDEIEKSSELAIKTSYFEIIWKFDILADYVHLINEKLKQLNAYSEDFEKKRFKEV